jgi:hypothetical protein
MRARYLLSILCCLSISAPAVLKAQKVAAADQQQIVLTRSQTAKGN